VCDSRYGRQHGGQAKGGNQSQSLDTPVRARIEPIKRGCQAPSTRTAMIGTEHIGRPRLRNTYPATDRSQRTNDGKRNSVMRAPRPASPRSGRRPAGMHRPGMCTRPFRAGEADHRFSAIQMIVQLLRLNRSFSAPQTRVGQLMDLQETSAGTALDLRPIYLRSAFPCKFANRPAGTELDVSSSREGCHDCRMVHIWPLWGYTRDPWSAERPYFTGLSRSRFIRAEREGFASP
jgi:hypothetical protein